MDGSRALTEAGISEREAEVLALVGTHLTNAQIAGRLVISVRTVESHVSSLLRKLDVSDRRALAELAPGLTTSDGDGVPTTAAIPAPLTSFVGRAAECDALAGAVGSHRLVTAVGPGGVGKTRLAVAVASEVTDRFESGAWYVDLVPVTDPAMVGAAVANVFGFGEQPDRSPTETLVAKLAAKEALLVLDNCEHLLDGVTELVERLLLACPKVTMLATSRTRLQVPYEYVFPVPGLSVDTGDASQLFVERAAMAGWTSHYADDQRRIEAICERLEGVALAIELAAARVATLGLDGLETGLTTLLGLLTGGSRLEERHRSVRSALDWSFDLLSEDEQVVLRRTSVFAAPFLASAAATVAGFAPLTSERLTQALSRLAEQNLVAVVPRPGGTRYRMLETIRQYGGERMDQVEEQTDVRRRHLSWCLKTATRLRDGATGEGSFDEVVDDLRAGLGWSATQPSLHADAHGLALRLAELTYAQGMPSEAQRRYEDAAALTSDPAQAGRALHLAAAVAWGRQSGSSAVQLFVAAADARRGGDPRAAALDLAMAAEIINRASGVMSKLLPEDAEASLLAQAQELAFGDPHLEAAMLNVVASADLSDPASGDLLERAAELARRVGDARLESAALDGLTAVQLALGEMTDAVETVDRRLHLLRDRAAEVELAWEYADSLHMAPMVNLTAGDLAAARAFSEERRALPFFREAQHLAVVWLLTTDAIAGDFNEAAALAERFRQGWKEAGRPPMAGYAFGPAAASMVYGVRGDDAGRAEWLQITADLRRAVSGRFGTDAGYLRTFNGLVELHHGRLDEALTATSRDPASLRSWPDGAWRQWYTAVWVETAVLAELPDRRDRLVRARFITEHHPVASVMVDRAEALADGDTEGLLATAAALDAAGCRYQAARSLVLAGGAAGVEGQARLKELGAAPMVVT